MKRSSPHLIHSDFLVPVSPQEAISLLPDISTMQQQFVLEEEVPARPSGAPSHPFRILNSVIQHFPAQDIYQVGRELGLREFRAFYLAYVPENPLLLDKDWSVILEMWWTYAYLSEYGDVDLDLSQEQNDYFFITFTNTQIHRTKDSKHKPVCPLIAGLLAGFFSGLSGFDYEAIETECHEQGHQNCTFILGNSGLVNSEKFWQTIHEIN